MHRDHRAAYCHVVAVLYIASTGFDDFFVTTEVDGGRGGNDNAYGGDSYDYQGEWDNFMVGDFEDTLDGYGVAHNDYGSGNYGDSKGTYGSQYAGGETNAFGNVVPYHVSRAGGGLFMGRETAIRTVVLRLNQKLQSWEEVYSLRGKRWGKNNYISVYRGNARAIINGNMDKHGLYDVHLKSVRGRRHLERVLPDVLGISKELNRAVLIFSAHRPFDDKRHRYGYAVDLYIDGNTISTALSTFDLDVFDRVSSYTGKFNNNGVLEGELNTAHGDYCTDCGNTGYFDNWEHYTD